MATYHGTVASTWPADAVFDYLATFSNAAEWDPGVLSAGRRDIGPLGVGTVFHLPFGSGAGGSRSTTRSWPSILPRGCGSALRPLRSSPRTPSPVAPPGRARSWTTTPT